MFQASAATTHVGPVAVQVAAGVQDEQIAGGGVRGVPAGLELAVDVLPVAAVVGQSDDLCGVCVSAVWAVI